MPDKEELSREEKIKARDERREKRKQVEGEDQEVAQHTVQAPKPSPLKMMSKINTTADGPQPPPQTNIMPLLPPHLRPVAPRPHMENVPILSPTPDDSQDNEEAAVSKGSYSQYAQQVRKATVPRTEEIPHSVEETKESLKGELQRMANVPKYIHTDEQTEILHSIPKHHNIVSKYNLAVEGVHLEDSGSDTDTPAQEEEEDEPEVMCPEEPLPKIRERYLSLVSGDVMLDDDGNVIPRQRMGSDPLLAEAKSVATRKESIDKAVQGANSLAIPDAVVRPHSPVPRLGDRYLDVAQGKAEPKPEDPEVEAHREALMEQLRETNERKKRTEEDRRQAYMEEMRYQEERRKDTREKPPVPIKTTKQDYLERMAAPIEPLPDDESVLAKASTPINAIKRQLNAAINKPVEQRYHGIDPVTQDFISSEIDQAPLPGHGLLKWRYAPKEEVPTAPREKPRLKAMGEFSWVSVDAIEKPPKEPAWKECLQLLNQRVTSEMTSPSPQE